MKLLTLCGSLRQNSLNRAIIDAFSSLAADSIEVTHCQLLSLLPHYNPDLDTTNPPESIELFRTQVRASDLLLLATPEYIHGLPGFFKNALDWLVSDPAFPGKPIAILHVANRSEYALASLLEILATMSADLSDNRLLARLPISSNQSTAQDILADSTLREILLALKTRIQNNPTSPSQSPLSPSKTCL